VPQPNSYLCVFCQQTPIGKKKPPAREREKGRRGEKKKGEVRWVALLELSPREKRKKPKERKKSSRRRSRKRGGGKKKGGGADRRNAARGITCQIIAD